MYSNYLGACVLKCCYFLFHSEVNFLCVHCFQVSDSGLLGLLFGINWKGAGALMGTIKTLRNAYGMGARSYVYLLQSIAYLCAVTSTNIFEYDVNKNISFQFNIVRVPSNSRHSLIWIFVLLFKYISFVYWCGNSFHSFSSARACTGHCLVLYKKYNHYTSECHTLTRGVYCGWWWTITGLLEALL